LAEGEAEESFAQRTEEAEAEGKAGSIWEGSRTKLLNFPNYEIGKVGKFDGITEFSELTEFWEGEFLTGRHEIRKYMKGRQGSFK
jgi:hypothetical protein